MLIKRILIETFRFASKNKAKIFDSLKYPGIGIFLISLFNKGDSDTFTIQSIILLFVNGYFYIIFTINCHRLFLEQEVPNGLIENFKWNKRNTNFLFTSFALAISMAVFFVPVFLISFLIFDNIDVNQFLVTFVVMLPSGYVFARLSLILPATAIDQDNSWSKAWNISRGHVWSLFFLISIFPFLLGFVIDTISSTSIIARTLHSVLSLLLLFYEISILSNSYKSLTIKEKATQHQGVVGGLA